MSSRFTSALRSASRARPSTWAPTAVRPMSARWNSTAAAEASTSAPVDPKIAGIVDSIAGLSLLQAAELVTQLKTRLNIQEIAMPAAAAPAAAPAAVEDVPAEKPKEKTIFNVKLDSFDAAAKPKIIKEVKAIVPNLTLIEAKKFVESLPKVLKENLSKEDAEKLKTTFAALGGVVSLE